ncbi:MAG: YkgJ family cysteine cluster protein [Hyphomicrobiaceae bacterium]
MIRTLSRVFTSRWGAPTLERVDTAVFTTTYFAECMACSFCHDRCCSYGADVDLDNRERLLAERDGLEAFTGVLASQWFRTDLEIADADFPSGRYTRTATVDGACVFLDRRHRGCRIHSYMLAAGRDIHELKPMVCSLFAVTFDKGLIEVSGELASRELICTGPGSTAYRAAREAIAAHFGDDLVAELDRIETETLADTRVAPRPPG